MSTIPTGKVDKPQPELEPLTQPTPIDALGLRSIPTELHFRRRHFDLPSRLASHDLVLEGVREVRVSPDELRSHPSRRTLPVVLECAGHRRAELRPPTAGVPWGVGAVAEARWTGVPLGALLREAGIQPGACAVSFQGRDRGSHFSSELRVPFARAIPLAKALDEDTLIAWEMNGEPIPELHGGPIRAIVPGYYAVDSVKWLERVTVLSSEFRGPFQQFDYRLFADAEGEGEGEELHALPVHSLISPPDESAAIAPGVHEVAGIAWGGSGGVERVDVRIDDGDWHEAELERPSDWGRVFWRYRWDAGRGPHVIAVRATDAAGTSQPDEPRWNRLGYSNNSIQRRAVHVGRPA
ncbi:MAG TPA: sulfite oxidase [Gaiellaceae bacterium]|jgi:DMSO/TMAO reductase YedYZ molybdopterin-dependent catalytic subunit|nr:sulfite oxidase [Gaiellaceae bacterium]